MKEIKTFISYSHKDKKYLDILLNHLNYLERNYKFNVWSDKKLEVGEDWKKRIEIELKTCDIALLLISTNFLISEFILEEELPILLNNAQKEGTKIIPIIVNHCMFDDFNKLSKLQALNNPSCPLEDLSESDINKLFKDLTKKIKDIKKKTKSIEIDDGMSIDDEIKLSVLQIKILAILAVEDRKKYSITEIQNVLKTIDRKGIVLSINDLIFKGIINKTKNDNKTLFGISNKGHKLYRNFIEILEK